MARIAVSHSMLIVVSRSRLGQDRRRHVGFHSDPILDFDLDQARERVDGLVDVEAFVIRRLLNAPQI